MTTTTTRRVAALRAVEADLLARLRELSAACETADERTYARLAGQMNRIETAAIKQGRFQIFAALSADEYAALKADIATRGVLVPVELDEAGAVLDGHHRVRACQELGITEYPRLVRTNLHSDAEKRSHVRALNLLRRHLTAEQRREVIAAQLADTPARSNRQIAQALGVTHPTVAKVRAELEQSGDVERITTSTDTRGRKQPAHKPKPLKPAAPAIVATTPAEERKAVAVATSVEPVGVVSLPQAEREIRETMREHARDEAELDAARTAAIDRDGQIAAARLVATYARWLSAITSNLLPLNAEMVAVELDEGDWRAALSARARLITWFERLIAARPSGLRVVKGGR
jgi:DNA-binding Lrp family transcriptional regulator